MALFLWKLEASVGKMLQLTVVVFGMTGEKFVIDWKPVLWTTVSHVLLS